MVKSFVENYFFITNLLSKTHKMAYLTFYILKFFGGGGGHAPRPSRGSCLRYSLLQPPTFIFQPSTPKLIENPECIYDKFNNINLS